MQKVNWELRMILNDTLSGQVVIDRLRGEGIDVQLRTDTALLGAARRCDVLVPADAARRARQLLSQEQFTCAELTSLATGELAAVDPSEPRES